MDRVGAGYMVIGRICVRILDMGKPDTKSEITPPVVQGEISRVSTREKSTHTLLILERIVPVLNVAFYS